MNSTWHLSAGLAVQLLVEAGQLLVEAGQLLLGAVHGVCLQELVSTDKTVLGGTAGTGKY